MNGQTALLQHATGFIPHCLQLNPLQFYTKIHDPAPTLAFVEFDTNCVYDITCHRYQPSLGSKECAG